jgi:hypothetical protein
MEDYPQGNYNAARGYGPEQESRNDADMRNSRSGRNIGGNRGNIDRYADEEFENENAYGRPGRNTDVDFADEDVRYGRDSQETDDLDREDRSSYGRSRGNWMTDNRHRQSPRSRNNQGY